eukprot:TRINITY_DN2256_c0_g1_i1.p1 TRINITY_DN2256_c0_g1~~TRINITY_DN2256_c0_g1_i1.p1  ORF type:complete len:168 (+),score=35.54 TRINITY_DN2256_c0_g1_i1:987-1490(+)
MKSTKKIFNLKNWVLQHKYWDRKLGRLGTGMLLDFVTDTFKAVQSGDYTGPKFVYFSAHDGTLLSLFCAMGLSPQQIDVPNYAATLLFELHQQGGKWKVKVEYMNSSPPKPALGAESYPLDRFLNLMSDGEIEFHAYVEECKLPNILVQPTESQECIFGSCDGATVD